MLPKNPQKNNLFIFPSTKFVKNCLCDQVTHIVSETMEVQLAYEEPDHQHLAEELCDLIHSAETALRILADRYEIDVLTAQSAVIEKNRQRGYYND
jgi:phosphoribosyl-ATP pyrophosphohydrolase